MMSRRVCVYVVVASLGLLLRGGPAFTQQAPEQPKPVEGQLSYDDIKVLLDNLGYDELKEFKDKDGHVTGYQVKRTAGTWSFYGVFCLSPDKTNIWISMCLGKVPDPGSVPGKVMLDILAANNRVWPSFFYYVESNNFIYLDSPIPNKNVKAKDLRSRFENMCEQVQRYESLWNPAKWPDAKK